MNYDFFFMHPNIPEGSINAALWRYENSRTTPDFAGWSSEQLYGELHDGLYMFDVIFTDDTYHIVADNICTLVYYVTENLIYKDKRIPTLIYDYWNGVNLKYDQDLVYKLLSGEIKEVDFELSIV